MSDLINIIDSWNAAEQASANNNYALAARMYRLCNVYYENGELNMYSSDAETKGKAAYKKYQEMLKKLPKDLQMEIKKEYAAFFGHSDTTFLCDWKAFVRQQYQIICG